MTEKRDKYRRWLAGSRTTEQMLIQTIEIAHFSFPETMWLANWPTPVTLQLDDVAGTPDQLFLPSRFVIQEERMAETTEQQITLTLSNYEGIVYRYLRDMTPAQRNVPITVIPRMYFDNADGGGVSQVFNKPPRWNIHNITATRDTVTGTLRATPLRTRRIGRYYTTFHVPALELLR